MTRGQRFLTYAVAVGAFVVFGWLAIFAAVWAFGGVATVSVAEHSEGFRFAAPVPMALIHAAVATAGTTQRFALHDVDFDIEGELGRWVPVVEAMIHALADAPDGSTFVSVVDGDDRVKVTKARGKLRVEVDSPDVTVKVSVPLRALARTVGAAS